MTKQFKNGPRPRVLIAARISGGKNQKEASLDDQEDHAREIAAEIYPGLDCEFIVTKFKMKGERLDRQDLIEIRHSLETGRIDLFLMEDVGRLVRGTFAKDLFCLAVEQGTRAIAINNRIDTNDHNWESELIKQIGEEVAFLENLSVRVTFKTLNRFKKYGQTPRRPIAGYEIPIGARFLKDWKRDEAATPIIRRGAAIYRETVNWTAVSDFFNTVPYKDRIGFPVGEGARQRTQWDGRYAANYYDNPIICGRPARQRRKNVKKHGKGRRVPRKHDNPTYYEAPHLAHISKAEFEELRTLRQTTNSKFKRKTVAGRDPLSDVSRGMSKFPGMHAICMYCGLPFSWGANGIPENLMCSGSRRQRCWNSRCLRGSTFRKAIAEALQECLFELEGYSDQYRCLVENAVNRPSEAVQEMLSALRLEESAAGRQLKNITDAIAETGLDHVNRVKQQQLRERLSSIARELEELTALQSSPAAIPGTVRELQALFSCSLERLLENDRSAAVELRSLISSVKVELVAYVDKPGYPLPRAHVEIDLASIVAGARRIDGLPALLKREKILDLFEAPQRARIMIAAARTRAANPDLNCKDIAEKITDGDKHPTDTAVGNALKLHDKMVELGLDSPLLRLSGPEGLSPKFKRRFHRNYEQKSPGDNS